MRCLTTPHKLQAEARSRKRVRRRLVVYVWNKPMAEACQLHAVVRRREGGFGHPKGAVWAVSWAERVEEGSSWARRALEAPNGVPILLANVLVNGYVQASAVEAVVAVVLGT